MVTGIFNKLRGISRMLKEGARRQLNLPNEVRVVCMGHSFDAENEQTTLHVEYYPDGVKNAKSGVREYIIIRGLQNPLIDIFASDLWLLGLEPSEMTIAPYSFVASSALLLASPILLGAVLVLKRQDQRHGMSRHSRVLFDALGGQLNETLETRLRRSLENLWLGHYWSAEETDIPFYL